MVQVELVQAYARPYESRCESRHQENQGALAAVAYGEDAAADCAQTSWGVCAQASLKTEKHKKKDTAFPMRKYAVKGE